MGADATVMIDRETHLAEAPEARHAELRLWLRLLSCTSLIEGEIRDRLRTRFGVTLPRFDLMAQLDRVEAGLTLSELSRRMMVSNGNLTGLVERLVASGHVTRTTSPTDRRVQVVRLTKSGRAVFGAMAAEHEQWIEAIFAGVPVAERRALMEVLGRVKASARAAIASGAGLDGDKEG